MLKKCLSLLFAGGLFATTSGCASFVNTPGSALLVQYATIKFINVSSNPVARAKRVVEIARAAQTFFSDDKLPLDKVEILIRRKIQWSTLSPEDSALVEALIVRVKSELEANPLPNNSTAASGSQVLSWIVDGARLAGG